MGGGGSAEKLAPISCSATISANDSPNFSTKSESYTRFHTLSFITIIFAVLMLMFVPTARGLEINDVNFPDDNLRSFISSNWDHGYSNSDGEWVGVHDGFLNATEFTDVTSLNWYNPTSAKGIEYFPNLEQILCMTGTLTELSVSSFSRLENLFCSENQLTNLDVSSNYALVKLECYSNKIESLNVSNNYELERLICVDNPLGKLDVSQNKKLQVLRCGSNDLKVLDVTNNTLLTEFECWGNHLTELDLSKNKALTTVLLGVQEVDGLKVKATLDGYEVCLKDYVSNVENIEVNRIGANNFEARLLSYDGLTGNVVFDECPKVLHYAYRTHSPNNDLLWVNVNATMNVDVIERGGPTDNIIWGISDNSYLDVTDNPIREDSIAGYSAKQYGKKGFVADGNSRLIVRVQTQRPGSVTFSVKENIGVEVESLRNRAKLTASTPVQTSSIGRDGYQASAVLVAPEEYPSWGSHKFPSENFTVNVKFTADDTGDELTEEEREIEEDITLEIHAAPVVLIHGFGRDAKMENTFGFNENVGIWHELVNAGFSVFGWNYNGRYGPSILFAGKDNELYRRIIAIFYDYNRHRNITCTKVDLVGYSMGGLVSRQFCLSQANKASVSYSQGMVRRIITVASPHRGSPWSSFYYDHPVIAEWILSQLFGNASAAWYDMLPGSEITSANFPVNVPMYSLYGMTREYLKLGITIKLADGIVKFANIEQVPLLYLAAIEAGLSLGTGIGEYVNEALFKGEDHDLCVSESSAAGDFSGHSVGFRGMKYAHTDICKQNDIGKKVVSLLKGNKSAFKTFSSSSSLKAAAVHKVGNSASYAGSSDTVESHFTLTTVPQVLNVSDTGTVKITAVSDTDIDGSIYMVISTGGLDRIFTVAGKNKRTFEATVEFTSKDKGLMDVSCFSGAANALYVSNTVRLVVNSVSSVNVTTELVLSGANDAIFLDADSEVGIGLYAKTSDGSMFDVSSPAMGTVWTSSNPAVAYVNDNGLIHAQADGTATLTAEYAGRSASIIVNVGNELYAPQILTAEISNGTSGRDYASQLQASGTPLIYWRIIDGRLPNGLELSSSGTISGNTYESGIFTFTVEASNIAGSDSREISVTFEGKILNENNFPDPIFWNFVVSTYDYNKDGAISLAELSGITGFDVSGLGISSLKGIEYFTALEYLTWD